MRCIGDAYTAGSGGGRALNAEPMISPAFDLTHYGEAIAAFRAGAGRKIQIRPQAAHSLELL
jgi:hypothetical protein